MAGKRPTVFLVDGHVYIFRAYYSMPSMEAPDGMPTGAAYGFANSLIKLMSDPEATHIGVCLDHSMTSFRNELFPDYKANRGETPEDLEPQFELCEAVARGLGLPVFSREGFEADDLIATLATRLPDEGANVVVVTTDKDLSQLVREDGRVVLHDIAKDLRLDAEGVRQKFGVNPAQIPDYLGLVGDTVDNLPGVPGIGPKSAAAALSAFGDIDGIPDEIELWSGVPVRGARRLAAAISTHREQALRTRDLATVRRDVPGLSDGVGSLAVAGALRDDLLPLFDRLGWGRIRDRVPRWQP
ncbi:MAG: 5'-3' exonuclease [Myxococcota bacterium]